jgi:IS30 family transposase
MTTTLNGTPRRCLGYWTPQDIFREQLVSLTTPV